MNDAVQIPTIGKYKNHPFGQWVGQPVAVIYWWGLHKAIVSDTIIDGVPALIHKTREEGMCEAPWREVIGDRKWYFEAYPSNKPRHEVLAHARKLIAQGSDWTWWHNCEDTVHQVHGLTVGSPQRSRAHSAIGAVALAGVAGAAYLLDQWTSKKEQTN